MKFNSYCRQKTVSQKMSPFFTIAMSDCQTCCSAYDVGGYKDKILWALRNFYRIFHSYEWLKKCIKMGTDRQQLKFRKIVSQDLLQVHYVWGLIFKTYIWKLNYFSWKLFPKIRYILFWYLNFIVLTFISNYY